MRNNQTLLEVKGLSVSFTQYETGLNQTGLHVMHDLNVTVHAGEMVAVIGSSGSGKSLLAHATLGILPYNAVLSGEMFFKGESLTQKRKEELRGSEIALVPQSLAYLDPVMKIGAQMRKGKKDAASRRKSREILHHYKLDEEVEQCYPFELSGGMTRRILISTALIETPALVVADEPTPGLDAALVRRILQHFRDIADEGAGVLLITHDLESALEFADRVSVLYAGTTVEEASASDFLAEETLRHPYTRALWRAMPRNGFRVTEGAQPYAKETLGGCPFMPRCGMASVRCRREIPWTEMGSGYVRCVHAWGVEYEA